MTRLILPPSILTQRAPNRQPLSREFNVESIRPRAEEAKIATPGAAPPPRPVRKFAPPTPTRATPPSPALQAAPTLQAPELGPSPQVALGVPNAPALAPPQPREEKPKIAFERPGSATGTARVGVGLRAPRSSVDEAILSAARGANSAPVVVGDEDAAIANPAPVPSPSQQPPGKLGSQLELLSDPMGADFRPYLLRVLAAVRRNWYSVIPESARLGRGGRVVIQFAISKDGSVPKLVIAMPSGAEALDRAAVAGISASNPFPPLPAEFRGGQIRLQLAFRYNSGNR